MALFQLGLEVQDQALGFQLEVILAMVGLQQLAGLVQADFQLALVLAALEFWEV